MTLFQKILIGVVVLLVIINSLLLGFIWINRSGAPERRGPHARPDLEITGRRLIRELEFNAEQEMVFRRNAKSHIQRMNGITSGLRGLKHKINQAILLDDQELYLEADSTQSVMQEKLDAETENFIRLLDSICTPEQKKKLVKMNEQAISRWSHHH